MKKYKYKFSVIIPVYNVEDYIEKTIESVINQTIGFENIQLILINDGSIDKSEEICLKYSKQYPENIVYQKQENSGVSSARNKGITLAEGELVTFLDSDDKWSLNSFKNVYHFYKIHKNISIFSCKMIFFDDQIGNHPLNYKYKKNKIVDILKEEKYIQLSSSSLFIKNEVVKKYKYDTKIKYSEDNKFINEIIFDEQKVMCLKTPIYYYRRRFDGGSAIQNQTENLDWYFVTPEKVYNYLFKLSKEKFGYVIPYIQFLVLYELNWRVFNNKNLSLKKQEITRYKTMLKKLLDKVDITMLLNHPRISLANKYHLLALKTGKDYINKTIYKDKYIHIEDYKYPKKSLGYLIIDQMYIRKNKMCFYGKLNEKYIEKRKFKIVDELGKKIKCNYYPLTNDYDVYSFDKKIVHKYIGIHFEIDIYKHKEISFMYGSAKLYPNFKRASFLSEFLPRSYHHIEDKTVYLKNESIEITKKNCFKSFFFETLNCLSLFKRKKYKNVLLRLYIKVATVFKRKPIWIISDRVDKADDNGEHFFKYLNENHKEINSYFVISNKSADYNKMKQYGKVLDNNSMKYKFLFLISDFIVSAHAEDYIFNAYGNSKKFIADLYYFKYIFLQHGIIKDDLSPWLNVNTKKMDMFVTSSKYEYDSLLDCNYYFGPKVVKLTGLPRYDSLVDKSKTIKQKNQILLSLTWRNSLANKIDKTTGKRMYNKEFIHSDYYKFINSLFNDKRLKATLKKYNYKIKFCPHPNVLPQLKDFQENELVIIDKGNIDYQKEFCENKLMITDYSSVFFDFAYLKKPIIYYQKDAKEFFEGQLYNKGYFNYKKMGFGPVFEDFDNLIDKVISYIENDCKNEEKYLKRIDKFFKYNDKKNCERIYKEIVSLDK